MRKKRQAIEIFSMSFLDVVSCGFGAIILLLVLSHISEPRVIEEVQEDLSGTLARLEEELHEIRGQSAVLNRQLNAREQQLSKIKEKLARLAGELREVEGEFQAAGTEGRTQSIIEKKLLAARQKLSAEMQRLLSGYQRPENAVIGGVPVDSEYIIFVIDTSGSMQQYAWPLVRKKMKEILDVHPEVKGIQVLNDMGDYMFSQYAGRWIPDSPARRRAILSRLSSWQPFSNSSPEEGVIRAIQRFYAKDKKISLYVFGDDFSQGSIQGVMNGVAAINRGRAMKDRLVRIHTVGFPVMFLAHGNAASVARFAALMRKLAEENNGSFVGLNSL